MASTGLGTCFIGSVASGGAGALAGNITTQMINTGTVDAEEARSATAAGMLGGAIGYGIGKVATKVAPKIASKVDDFAAKVKALRNGGSVEAIRTEKPMFEYNLQFFAESSEGCPFEGGRKTGTYSELRNGGYKDAHHIIQDAAVKDIPGYKKGAAPAIQLEGPSNSIGSEHYKATISQRNAIGGGTYGEERKIALNALQDAGIPLDEATKHVQNADKYFMDELGINYDTPTRIPGNRKGF